MWEDLRALNASLQRTLDAFRCGFEHANTSGAETPDAHERLNYVLGLTEAAAHRTLDLVERSRPLVMPMTPEAAALIEQIRSARHAHRNSGIAALLARIETYLSIDRCDRDVAGANLNEVLVAQSYHDLSGRIIRTFINLLIELERPLARRSACANPRSAIEA